MYLKLILYGGNVLLILQIYNLKHKNIIDKLKKQKNVLSNNKNILFK